MDNTEEPTHKFKVGQRVVLINPLKTSPKEMTIDYIGYDENLKIVYCICKHWNANGDMKISTLNQDLLEFIS